MATMVVRRKGAGEGSRPGKGQRFGPAAPVTPLQTVSCGDRKQLLWWLLEQALLTGRSGPWAAGGLWPVQEVVEAWQGAGTAGAENRVVLSLVVVLTDTKVGCAGWVGPRMTLGFWLHQLRRWHCLIKSKEHSRREGILCSYSPLYSPSLFSPGMGLPLVFSPVPAGLCQLRLVVPPLYNDNLSPSPHWLTILCSDDCVAALAGFK